VKGSQSKEEVQKKRLVSSAYTARLSRCVYGKTPLLMGCLQGELSRSKDRRKKRTTKDRRKKRTTRRLVSVMRLQVGHILGEGRKTYKDKDKD
jgi:hypothetical protein